MVRPKEMNDAVRIDLMMDSSIVDSLNEMANKTKVTRSRLIRIACNILISLVKDEYINEDALDQVIGLLENEYDIDFKGKLALRKDKKKQVRESLVYDLYKIFTNDLLRESIDDIGDSGLLYYYDIGDFIIKPGILGLKEFDAEGIKILSELIKKEKLKKRKNEK